MSMGKRAAREALQQRVEALLSQSPATFTPADVKTAAELAQELAVFQAEVELQNEELRETQAALRQAHDRFAALYEHAPAGYVVLDASGIVRQTNATYRAMLNRPNDDLRGRPFTEAIVPDDVPIFLGRFRAFFRNPADKQIVLRLRRAGGEAFDARIEAGRWPVAPELEEPSDPAALELMVIVTDITDLRSAQRRIEDQHRALQQAHERTARLNAVLHTIRKVNQLITREQHRERLLSSACSTLTERLSYHNAWIGLLADSGGAVSLTADAGFDGGFATLRARLVRGEFPYCLHRALAGDETVVIDDPPRGCPDCPVSSEYHGRASLVRRLAFSDRVFGVLAASVPPAFAHDADEQALFDELAGDLAFALHRIDVAERLRDAEHYVRTVLDTTGDGFLGVDSSGNVVDVNDAYCAVSRYARQEILGLSIGDLDVEERPEPIAFRMARVMAKGYEVFTTHHRRKDGSVFPVEGSATFLREQGRFIFFCRDISDRVEREERIALLGRMLDEAPAAITIHDDAGRFFFANREAVVLHGYADEAEFRAVNLRDLDVPESAALVPERLRIIAETGEARFDVAHYRKDGSTFPLEVFAKRIVWEGRPAVLSIATDITERKRAEEELRRRETLLERIFDVLPVGLWLADRDGTLLRANPAGVRIWGAAPRVSIKEYGIFKAWRLPSREPVRPEEWALARTIREGVTIVDELLEIEAFDGMRRTILNYTAPLLDERGAIEGAIIINLDVSDRTAMEDRLAQAQKLEAVGRLAGGVAHDFNNMLNVILGFTDLALQRVDPSDPLHPDLEEVRHAASRSAEITRQLLAFARRQTISPIVLDLNAKVESMLKMLRRLIGEDITLLWHPGEGLWSVRMDPSQVDQILANLCINARDAIDGVGRITIESSNVSLTENDRGDTTETVPGDYVRLSVSDDGCGMDADTLRKVFEPFFTTKGPGSGTGLGLATVYGIVKQNDGFINAYSEPGKGTTFHIYLRRHATENVAPVADDPDELPRGRGEKVLIVEDEASILKLATRMLQRLGYEVLGASSPQKALALAGAHPGAIHLLISDVVMPDMNGRDLADRLLAQRPGLKVLFMSGYTANVIARRGVLDEGVAFIQKPFAMRDFAVAVRSTLDA